MHPIKLLLFGVLAGLAGCSGNHPEQVIGQPPAVSCCWGGGPDQLMPPNERLLRISIKVQTGFTEAGQTTLRV